jgi:hypothetical protein
MIEPYNGNQNQNTGREDIKAEAVNASSPTIVYKRVQYAAPDCPCTPPRAATTSS